MSVAYPHPLIAKEGWPFLAIAVAVAAAAGWFAGWWWSAPLWVAALFVLQFFRDPPREVPADPRAVVSPADGRIVVVGKARDPYRDCDALKISVFMNVFNVHSNRSPVDGIVGKVEYHAGSFFNAALDKASLENERNALLMTTRTGQEITCVQVAGLIARRILCDVREGDAVHTGGRFGIIRFGSRVDVYLPHGTEILVTAGITTVAGETVLARFT